MFQGKTALITGSTSGIGLGIAKELASKGANIILNGFGDPAEIKSIQSSISENPGIKVHYNDADMSKPGEIKSMCLEALKIFGAVDILVNNAGIQFVGPIDTYPEEKWDQIIAINLSAAFHTMKHCIPRMRERKWGRIINIASVHGLVASPFKGAYIASKHGIIGLTKTAALETAEDGITCNTICPGYVFTPLVEKQIPGQAKNFNMSEEEVIEKVMLKAQPTKKFIEIEEIARLASFLCEDTARSITGANYSIDGAWSTH